MRILGIDPNSKGISFAILEDGDKLIDRGTKHLPKRKKGDEKVKTSCKRYYSNDLRIMENLIDFFNPDAIVCENTTAKNSRRGTIVRDLLRQISLLAAKRKLAFHTYSRIQVMETLAQYGVETKHDMASLLGRLFFDLESKVPKKRKAWTSESVWMNVFMALALCVTFYEQERHLQ
jgi:Holliday junction resolvasome RuvABC endonuclease subunit